MKLIRRRKIQREVVARVPVYFPCPECGVLLDALDGNACALHGKHHADMFLRSIGVKP